MHDFDDDEFYTDDDELAEDNDPGVVGDAKNRLLESANQLIQVMKRNIVFNERKDYKANLEVLSSYVTNLLDLENLADAEKNNQISEDELLCKIEEIVNKTTVVTLENIDSIIPEDQTTIINQKVEDDTDSGTDW